MRLLLVALALIAPATWGTPWSDGAPTQLPPDSLEPGEAQGKVRLTHRHRRIVECHEKDSKPLRCSSSRVTESAATQLTLHPIKKRHVAKEDRRQPVSVSFKDEKKRGERWLHLRAGTWEVRWEGRKKRERFEVKDGDEFKVWLRTVTGACAAESSECVLVPGKRQRRVVIPSAHRAGAGPS